MAMLPKLRIKALVSFPANVFGGTGISIDKTAGNFTIDLNYSEFAFQGTLPTGSNVLVWDPVANVYTLIPPSATGGISDAPTDGKVYGRKSAAWVDAWASPVLTGNPTAPTPSPGDNDTSVATTAFVAAAVTAGGGALPATAVPIVESGLGSVGTSLKYAREDHVHPALGGAGSGDVVGPSGAVDSNLAAFNTTTGKLIKDSGVPLAAASGAVRFDSAQTLTAPQQAQARANINSAPTRQVFVSGSGTYTRPTPAPLYIKVRMAGGGGGGGGSGTGSTGGSGGNGTASTFGAMTANFGGGAPAGGGIGVGGAAPTITATVWGLAGGNGGGIGTSIAGTIVTGGAGGMNAFFAGGTSNTTATPNTGAGGSGGFFIAAGQPGAGGGAGASLEAFISSPAATYSYTVGGGGSPGLAGTSGQNGFAGATGIIIVDEYYQ